MLTLDKIYHAAFVLKDVARKTDLIEAPKLSKDCQHPPRHQEHCLYAGWCPHHESGKHQESGR